MYSTHNDTAQGATGPGSGYIRGKKQQGGMRVFTKRMEFPRLSNVACRGWHMAFPANR